MRSSTAANCGLSPRCPAVIRIDSGLTTPLAAQVQLRGPATPRPPQRVVGRLDPGIPAGWFGLQIPFSVLRLRRDLPLVGVSWRRVAPSPLGSSVPTPEYLRRRSRMQAYASETPDPATGSHR